jgi:hypothetical protein
MSLDNFAYIITDQKTTVIIDPGDPEPVCVSIEWVSDCCLMPTQQFFSFIMGRTG